MKTVALMSLATLAFVFGIALASTTYFASYSVKKTPTGKKHKDVFILSFVDNEDGTGIIIIDACGTVLEFSGTIQEMDTQDFQNYFVSVIDGACK